MGSLPAWGTTTSGVMSADETWSGTVLLKGDVTVATNATLTILPGTRVEFNYFDREVSGTDTARVELVVEGSLNATGTDVAPILFTSHPQTPPAAPGDWVGVTANAPGNSVTFRHCVFEFASTALTIANATVDSCEFHDNAVCGLHGDGAMRVLDSVFGRNGLVEGSRSSGNAMVQVSGHLYMTNCVVTNRFGTGIYLGDNGGQTVATMVKCKLANNSGRGVLGSQNTIELADCSINDNGDAGIDGSRGFNTDNQWFGTVSATRCSIFNNPVGIVSSSLSLVDCQVHDNSTGVAVAISWWPGGPPTSLDIRSSVFRGNSVAANSGTTGSTTVTNSVFANNNTGISVSRGGEVTVSDSIVEDNGDVGIDLNPDPGGGPTVNPTIHGCHVRNNGIGIRVRSAIERLGTITGNTITSNITFELKNGGSSIIATNNFWGEPTTSELRQGVDNLSRIYDFIDDRSVGLVVLDPYLTMDIDAKPPVIAQQPQDATAPLKGAAVFSVVAEFASRYQWAKEGVGPLAEATNAILTLSPLTLTDAGRYRVEVRNEYGSTNSDWATLTVLVPPTITEDPKDALLLAGATATLSVRASGSQLLTYRWQFNRKDLVDGNRVQGAGTPNLSIAKVSLSDRGNYRCIVGNEVGEAASKEAVLEVATEPSITQSPTDQIVTEGHVATLSVSASGTPPLSFQWQFGEQDIPKATNATLTLPSVTGANAGSYRVVVRNMAGSTNSAAAHLTVTGIDTCAVITLNAEVGSRFLIEWSDLRSPGQWQVFSNLTVTTSPQVLVDVGSTHQSKRIYRVTER